MKTLQNFAGPVLLLGTLAFLISIGGRIQLDRKYSKVNPVTREKIARYTPLLRNYGFVAVALTLPICCLSPSKKK